VLQHVLTDLRMNYVDEIKKGGAPTAAEPAPEPGPAEPAE
jgi:hypothetical protein